MWGEKIPSPERPRDTVEVAMKKVADIDTPNVGYSCVGMYESSPSVVSAAIRDGILGFSDGAQEKDRSRWASETRTQGDNVLYFNIVGRAKDTAKKDPRDNRTEIGRSFYFRPGPTRSVAFLFDIEAFVEQEPQNRGVRSRRDTRTFRADDYSVQAELNRKVLDRLKDVIRSRDRSIDAQGRPRPHSEFGFALSHRVPPRSFTGIVFQIPRKKTPEEIGEDVKGLIRDGVLEANTNITDEVKRRLTSPMEIPGNWTIESDPGVLRAAANVIASEMAEQLGKTPERSIPIYDSLGNLWWPKVMSREDIRRLQKR